MKHWWLPTTHLPPHILTICGTICGSNFFLGKNYRPPYWFKWICPEIFLPIFYDNLCWTLSGPRAKNGPKVNRRLKIVWLFYMYAVGPILSVGEKIQTPEVDLNGYPRISNPYCRDIQIRTCEWTQGKIMTQSKSQIKNSILFYMYAALLL